MSYPVNIGEAARAAENGYRQCTERDADMPRFIRQARSMSFSIKQAELLLSLRRDPRREAAT